MTIVFVLLTEYVELTSSLEVTSLPADRQSSSLPSGDEVVWVLGEQIGETTLTGEGSPGMGDITRSGSVKKRNTRTLVYSRV